jgi:uncharacterized NAD(P)/FAD-binding protein YdhS
MDGVRGQHLLQARADSSRLEPRPSVAVIGGGFSGLLTAIHLLRADPDIEVRLVERESSIGRGRAYRTQNPDHLLNVRASNMSAFPSQPDHFQAWLGGERQGDLFVSRGRYGDYLQAVLDEETSRARRAGRFRLEQGEAVCAEPAKGRWRIALASGRNLEADAVVLALGLSSSATWPGTPVCRNYVPDPWACDLETVPEGDILLIGSGLTMVDVALSLAGPRRRLTAVSRRGLLPLAHATAARAAAPEGPLATPLKALRALRAHADAVGWREAVDSLRPSTASVWRSWTLDERRRFLRHARPWWDIHRHRMAPAIADRVSALRACGQLDIMGGRVERLESAGGSLRAAIRPRGARRAVARTFAAVINCTSPSADPQALRGGLLADLHQRGLARRDPLELGLDVDDQLRVLDENGDVAPGLFAVGPLTRALVWEAVAVPDLRNQTAQVAAAVTLHLRDRVGGER